MRLDCHCGGWVPGYLRALDPSMRPIVWRCALCARRICSDCEGTHCGVEAVDRVCDLCWAGVVALVAVLVARGRVGLDSASSRAGQTSRSCGE